MGEFTIASSLNLTHGAQISKHEPNVDAAIRNFSAMIVVANHPTGHWITLHFNPKENILEVFDSMAPHSVESQMEKIRKVRFPQQLTTNSDTLNNK